MNSVLWLQLGLMLGQAEPTPVRATLGLPTAAPSIEAGAPNDTPDGKTESAEVQDSDSIFARPLFLSRHSLAFVLGSGPGRFNQIDWESRPNPDRIWWLGRWPSSEEAHLYAQIGFGIHWWAGPVGDGIDAAPNLPPQLFDLYLECAWEQRWTDWFSTQVCVRPGLYTDFRTTPPDAFRAPGEAIALLRVRPDFFLVGGVEHIQRNEIHVLPIAGVLWQPSPAWELGLVFPEPKIAAELSARHHLWGYVAAEYGGGRWTFKNDFGHSERVEYSDFRVVAGIEWREDYLCNLAALPQKAMAYFEIGYIFERQLHFTGPSSRFDPEPTWMIRFGHTW